MSIFNGLQISETHKDQIETQLGLAWADVVSSVTRPMVTEYFNIKKDPLWYIQAYESVKDIIDTLVGEVAGSSLHQLEWLYADILETHECSLNTTFDESDTTAKCICQDEFKYD